MSKDRRSESGKKKKCIPKSKADSELRF